MAKAEIPPTRVAHGWISWLKRENDWRAAYKKSTPVITMALVISFSLLSVGSSTCKFVVFVFIVDSDPIPTPSKKKKKFKKKNEIV